MKNEQALSGIDLIARKRAKHVSKGWTKEHDKLHKNGELAIVAADIALRHTTAYVNSPSYIPRWGLQKKDLINRLAIAGSLIAAEIDRLNDYTPLPDETDEVQDIPPSLPQKTLQECKDEAVKSLGLSHQNWKEVELFLNAAILPATLNMLVDNAMKFYASQQRVQEWISVEERLPESEERVLCLHIDSGNMFLCYRTKDCHTQEPIWHGGAMPTHWMPLPKKQKA